jgi:hypothetical protein
MDRRLMLTLATILVAVSTTSFVAKQPPDNEAVKAASKAFYSTLSVLDDGSAMEKVSKGHQQKTRRVPVHGSSWSPNQNDDPQYARLVSE